MRLVINVAALLVVAYIVPGFVLESLEAAIVTAIVIGTTNTFIRPVVLLFALPISIMTMGIFAFLINVLFLWAVSLIVPGFEIASFMVAITASILLTLVSWFLNKLAKD